MASIDLMHEFIEIIDCVLIVEIYVNLWFNQIRISTLHIFINALIKLNIFLFVNIFIKYQLIFIDSIHILDSKFKI